MTKPEKVIADTNVLHYATDKNYSDDVASILQKLDKQAIKLVVSGYQLFEVYRGLKKEKIPVTKQLLSPITPLEVDTETFKISAALYTCYKYYHATQNPKDKGKPRWDDGGDLVIGATSFRYDVAILTSNGNDFPRPFFSEVGDRFTIKHKNNGAEITIHLLKPEIKVFNQMIKECLK